MIPYHWTQVVNIKRDPFETSIGEQIKTLFGQGGALAGPVTAYVYDWNMLPIGQALWLKELETYIDYPPMQDPASYNLEQVIAAGSGDEERSSRRRIRRGLALQDMRGGAAEWSPAKKIRMRASLRLTTPQAGRLAVMPAISEEEL